MAYGIYYESWGGGRYPQQLIHWIIFLFIIYYYYEFFSCFIYHLFPWTYEYQPANLHYFNFGYIYPQGVYILMIKHPILIKLSSGELYPFIFPYRFLLFDKKNSIYYCFKLMIIIVDYVHKIGKIIKIQVIILIGPTLLPQKTTIKIVWNLHLEAEKRVNQTRNINISVFCRYSIIIDNLR